MDYRVRDSRRDNVDEELQYKLQQDDIDNNNRNVPATESTAIERITKFQESQDNDEETSIIYDDDSMSVDTPKPRNGCVPEVEELPVNQIMEHLEYYDQDLAWSFLSNTCFMMGGIAYMIQSTWDCFDDDPQSIGYRLLDSIAPAIYVVNSVIDTEWAMKVKKRSDIDRRTRKGWSRWRSVFFGDNKSNADDMSLVPEVLSTTSSVWKQEIRQYAAHRRTILAAMTFGIAALIAFVASFVSRFRAELDNASDHVYVLSAVIAITGKRSRPWLAPAEPSPILHDPLDNHNNNDPPITRINIWDSPEILRDSGDLLFFVGCVIDATMGDFRVDAPFVSVFSAWLWLIDSCLYIRSDIVRSKQLTVEEEQR